MGFEVQNDPFWISICEVLSLIKLHQRAFDLTLWANSPKWYFIILNLTFISLRHQKRILFLFKSANHVTFSRFLLSRGGQILRPKIHKVSFGKKFLIRNFRFYVSQFENVKIAQIVVGTFHFFFRTIEILNDQNKN